MNKRSMEETTSTLCRREGDEIQPSIGKDHESIAQSEKQSKTKNAHTQKNMEKSGAFGRGRREAHGLHPRAMYKVFLQEWAEHGG